MCLSNMVLSVSIDTFFDYIKAAEQHAEQSLLQACTDFAGTHRYATVHFCNCCHCICLTCMRAPGLGTSSCFEREVLAHVCKATHAQRAVGTCSEVVIKASGMRDLWQSHAQLAQELMLAIVASARTAAP